MPQTDPERLELERLHADRRYNEALTALDRAVTDAMAPESSAALARDTASRLAPALIVFLQQITAFVETKDRQLAADAARRIESLAPAGDAVGELRTQVNVLRRAVDSVVSRQAAGSVQPSGAGQQASSVQQATATPRPAPSLDGYKYVGFEDQFRGSDEAVAERLRAYVPIFAGCTDVLDIGCGRGELLGALRAAGVSARGLDANADMVAVACARGLDATRADALAYLSAMPDESLGGVISTQVIEHLEPSYLMRLLDTAAQKLQPGSPIVLETINPACWLAFFSSYIRDFTHVRPVHPETLQYLLRASGFERVEIRYSAPVQEHMKMKTVDLPADVLASSDSSSKAMAQIAHAVNANAVILNNLLFSYLDYAAIGYRS